MYTIKRAADLVGVSVSTLRAWERRYGIAAPGRTDAGYRLYDDEAVRALSLMHSLVREGWSAREAAEEARRRVEVGVDASDDRRTDVPDGAGAGAAGGAALVEAAASLDAAVLGRLLDGWFSTASFETVADTTLLPALADLGRAWEAGRITVAGEHLVAHAVGRRLSAAYDASGEPHRGPRVLVGLPPGSRHELGLLAFAVAARRKGLAVTYLGADVPVPDWVAALTPEVDAVVTAVSMPGDDAAGAEVVAALGSVRPDLLIAVGGSRQDRVPPPCLRLGHDVGPASALLAEALSGL